LDLNVNVRVCDGVVELACQKKYCRHSISSVNSWASSTSKVFQEQSQQDWMYNIA